MAPRTGFATVRFVPAVGGPIAGIRTIPVEATVRLPKYAVFALAVALLAGCSPDSEPAVAPTTTPPPSASVTPSEAPTKKPTPKPTAKPTPKPTASPSPSPTATPKPTTPPGKILTAQGAFLEVSEDENLTTPDPENGCEVHDPDLDQVTCGVVSMAGGLVTWVTGYEQHNLPGESEPRRVVRVYRRLANGQDSMTHVGFGDPGTWGAVEGRAGSLTGQTRDSLVVVVTFRGSGTYAGYDVLTWRAGGSGPRLRAHHAAVSHGQVYVRSRGYISTYEADYSDGAPNCCPTSWKHDNVYYDGTNFRLRYFANVAQPPPG